MLNVLFKTPIEHRYDIVSEEIMLKKSLRSFAVQQNHSCSQSRPRCFLLLNFTRALLFRAAKLSGTRLIIGSVLSLIISNYVSRLSSRPCSRWLEPMGEKGRALIHACCYYCRGLSGDRQPRLKYAALLRFKLIPKFTLLTPKIQRVNTVDYQIIGVAGLGFFIWIIFFSSFYLDVVGFVVCHGLWTVEFILQCLEFVSWIVFWFLAFLIFFIFFNPAIFVDADRQVNLFLSFSPFLCHHNMV